MQLSLCGSVRERAQETWIFDRLLGNAHLLTAEKREVRLIRN